VNRSPLRRAVAEQAGVTVIDGGQDLPARVRAALGGAEADAVFEASGAPELVQAAIDTVRPGGTVVMVALYERAASIVPTLITTKELTIRGSATYTPGQFAEAIGLLASGQVTGQSLITKRVPLADLGRAFEEQLDKAASVKVMITMDQ